MQSSLFKQLSNKTAVTIFQSNNTKTTVVNLSNNRVCGRTKHYKIFSTKSLSAQAVDESRFTFDRSALKEQDEKVGDPNAENERDQAVCRHCGIPLRVETIIRDFEVKGDAVNLLSFLQDILSLGRYCKVAATLQHQEDSMQQDNQLIFKFITDIDVLWNLFFERLISDLRNAFEFSQSAPTRVVTCAMCVELLDQVFRRIGQSVFQIFHKQSMMISRSSTSLLIDVEAYELFRMGIDQALKQSVKVESLAFAKNVLDPQYYGHQNGLTCKDIEKITPFRDVCIKILRRNLSKECDKVYSQFTYIVDESVQDASKQQIEVNMEMKERTELLDDWVDLLFDCRDHLMPRFPQQYNIMEEMYGIVQDYVEQCIIWVVGHESEFQNDALLVFMQWVLGFAAEEKELGVNMKILHEQLELMNTQFVKRADQLMMQCVDNIDNQTRTMQLSQDQVSGRLYSGAVQELFFMINTQVDVVREWGNVSLLHKLGYKIQEHLKSFAQKQSERVSGSEEHGDTENVNMQPASGELPQLHDQHSALEFAIATANNAIRGYKLTEELQQQLEKILGETHEGWQDVYKAFLECTYQALVTMLDVIWHDVRKLFFALFSQEWLDEGTQVKTILATFKDYFENDFHVLLDPSLLPRLYILCQDRFTVHYAAELLGIRGTQVPETARQKDWKLRVIDDICDVKDFFMQSKRVPEDLMVLCDGLLHAIMELVIASDPYKMVAAYSHILDNFGEIKPTQLKKVLEHRGWEEWLSKQVSNGVKDAYSQWENGETRKLLPPEGIKLLAKIESEVSKRGWRLLQRKRNVLKAVAALKPDSGTLADLRKSMRDNSEDLIPVEQNGS
eukprot:TRINITY_DN4062_c0_g2_i4.p1 TRINITY_DN4062_c0_g2~~TRINITY_DN4062_c0_g2_i4.p1  ORF type:complete len:844 (-),score=111.98 TRINITY_DN4062_c0_g2_i4:262-2793(-)